MLLGRRLAVAAAAAIAAAVAVAGCLSGPGACRIATHLGSEGLYIVLGMLVYILVDASLGSSLVASMLLAASLTVLLKTSLGLPRPPPWEWLAPATGPGFPSGHTSVSTAFWALLAAWELGPAALPLGLGVGAAVGYTRIALRVHSPLDVAGGLAVGAFAAFVLYRLSRGLHGVEAAALVSPPSLLAAVLAVLASPGYGGAYRVAGIAAGLAASSLYMVSRGCIPAGGLRGRGAVRALLVSAAGAAAAAVGGENGVAAAAGFAALAALVVLSRCLVDAAGAARVDAE